VSNGDNDGLTAEERMRRAAEQSEQARLASERTRPVAPTDPPVTTKVG
jgi:hypothetical protein